MRNIVLANLPEDWEVPDIAVYLEDAVYPEGIFDVLVPEDYEVPAATILWDYSDISGIRVAAPGFVRVHTYAGWPISIEEIPNAPE